MTLKNYTTLIALGLIALTIVSCKKDTHNTKAEPVQVAENFNYATTQEIEVNLNILNPDNSPQAGVRFTIYSPDGKRELASGASDAYGMFHTIIRTPIYMEEVYVIANRVGDNKRHIPIYKGKIIASFGGNNGTRGKHKSDSIQYTYTPAGDNWYYMGTYDTNGVPDYLVVPGDVVDNSFISDISSTLPETFNIPANKPNLLVNSNDYDIHMIAQGDIWITYLAEGAGQQNSFGYFVYPTNNPPATPGDIDSIYTVFPNSSNFESGGGLIAGDKVYLGEFPAGVSIGWVILSNGWNYTNQNIKASNLNQTRLYSLDHLNTFTSNVSKRRHSLQLLDPIRELIVVGFEDVRRDYSSDEDFNDILFFATVTPFSAAFTDSIPMVDYCAQDDDGDGISNCSEDYRHDPLRAYDNVVNGTLAFEDLWPGKGDYDFNDMVVDYSTNYVTDANNQVKDIKTTYTVKAVGASLNNGFGVEVKGLSPANVESATGSNITTGMINLSNGIEASQTNVVMIAFDDIFDHIYPVSGDHYINTVTNETQVNPVSFQLDLTLNNPVNVSSIGLPPYNPFIFTDSLRGREIHLADMTPTDLHNPSFYGTFEDDSDPGSNRYYKSHNNLPWAIHIDESFDYPKEKVDITEAYLNFSNWANSGGVNFPDWFKDLNGYRDPQKIY